MGANDLTILMILTIQDTSDKFERYEDPVLCQRTAPF